MDQLALAALPNTLAATLFLPHSDVPKIKINNTATVIPLSRDWE